LKQVLLQAGFLFSRPTNNIEAVKNKENVLQTHRMCWFAVERGTLQRKVAETGVKGTRLIKRMEMKKSAWRDANTARWP